MFDPTKPVQTRNGRKARIIATDRSSPDFPIVALVEDECGGEQIVGFTSTGKWCKVDQDGPADLINIPEETSRWLNVYAGSTMAWLYNTKEDANFAASTNWRRVTILEIKMEGEQVKDVVIHRENANGL